MKLSPDPLKHHNERNKVGNVISSHCGKADVRTIGYLQPNTAGTSNDQIL